MRRCCGRTPRVAGPAAPAERFGSKSEVSGGEPGAAVLRGDFTLDQVHRGRAHEPGDEEGGRTVVNLVRRADLLQPAFLHDRDTVPHGHRLHLVVGDDDHGGPQPLLEIDQLGTKREPQRGIERGKGLVEKKSARLTDDGLGGGDALALPAGELARQLVQKNFDAEDRRGFGNAPVGLLPSSFCFARLIRMFCRADMWG